MSETETESEQEGESSDADAEADVDDAEEQSESESEGDSESETESESESESQQESEGESESQSESESTDEADEADESGDSDSAGESDEADETDTPEPSAVDSSDVDADNTIEGILAIRQSVEATAGSLIGHKFDGVSEIEATDDGWRSVVEVVERKSIPDTQDVIGRYEVDLDEEGVIEGYSRLNRYRRGDTTVFE